MFSGKYTTVKELIERVYRKYPFQEVFEDEVKEHVYTAMNKLGRPEWLEDATSTITISEYKGLLPDNISEGGITACRDAITKTVMMPSKDIFLYQNQEDASTNVAYNAVVAGVSLTGSDDLAPGDPVTLETNNVLVEALSGKTSPYSSDTYTYRVNGNYLFTGFRSGEVEISYKAYPIWELDGSPKIPDDTKVMEMLVCYVSLQIATRLLFQGKLNMQLYQLIEQDYYFNVGAARNRLMQPDLSELESMRRAGMRLLPKPNQFATGFRYINEQERLRGN